jgi:hypothetical protein
MHTLTQLPLDLRARGEPDQIAGAVPIDQSFPEQAGFVLMNRWVVFSENPASVHIRDLKALKHDVILVLKPDDGAGEAPQWPEPVAVDTSDSEAFCRDCGAALGWFLTADVDDERVYQRWRSLLEGDDDG